jgi:hypothetical protein
MIYAMGRIMPKSVQADFVYLKLLYKYRMGRKLDLQTPKTYNEKLQWLKLYDRNPQYIKLVDKYEVRKYIADKIGKEYLIPLLGVWNKFEDIEFDKLPEQFVLKCTHDSGSTIVCKDKNSLDIIQARKKINHCLRKNFYYNEREWPYKNIKPRIIAEKYMVDESGVELKDYKFFCFNGQPKALHVIYDREIRANADFFDIQFNKLPVKRSFYEESNRHLIKPAGFDKMIEISEILSKGFRHIRVDLYNISGKIYFGELTFYPCSGFKKFIPEHYDIKFGDWLKLS